MVSQIISVSLCISRNKQAPIKRQGGKYNSKVCNAKIGQYGSDKYGINAKKHDFGTTGNPCRKEN